MSDPVVAGQAALAEGRWRDAADAFEAAVARDATAEALYGLGMALWWLGEQRRHVEACTAAYVAFRRARDDSGAVLAALGLCCTFKSNFGDDAVADGWARRAERLVAEDGPLQGWVWQIRAYVAPGDPAAVDLARRAHEAGRRGGDVDLELSALATLGHALVVASKVEEGLGLVDEAMAGTVARECEQLETTVVVCCEMLDACDAAGDLGRAAQWCRVAEQFAVRYGSPYLYVRCRVLYGAVLARAGELDRAETELRVALDAADGAGPAWRAQVLARLAALRLCRGDIEEAESLLGRCAGQAVAVEATAAVHLARGAPAIAVSQLERALRSVHGRRAAALLAALVAAGLAVGDADRAAASADELADLADVHSDPDVVAGAAFAAGRVALARGTPAEAVRHLERAVAVLTTSDALLDAARARLELARALVPLQAETAVAEARAALSVFDAAGAVPDADAAAALLRSLGVAGRTGPRDVGVLSERERQVLRLVTHGLSNLEIAERLHISRKTAAHHVSHVLTKLDLPNRAAAAAYGTREAGGPVPGATGPGAGHAILGR